MTTTSATESARPVTIRAQKVSKHYGEFAALQEVSFEVKRGTVAAFLGPNGAGKSTTMRILTGYLAPTAGRVEVLDLDPTRADERIRLARRLGYLPENGPVYHDMTPLESLRFFGEVCKLGKDLEAAIDRVIDICALGSVLQKPIHKLSKGFRQRVGMARALLHDPEVLIMDEPTSGLDPLQIREVRGLIRELGKDKTILLSTHILQEVEAMADDVIVISEGRIVFAGSKERLLAPGSAESVGDADTGEGKSVLERRFYQLTRTKEEAA
jgi:ABC-2 type transport system ATP-binding protein